jgi:hypothetical protein
MGGHAAHPAGNITVVFVLPPLYAAGAAKPAYLAAVVAAVLLAVYLLTRVDCAITPRGAAKAKAKAA